MCPVTPVDLTCSHDSAIDATRWDISAPIDCAAVVSHSANPSSVMCGPFTVSRVSASDQSTRTSTLVLPVGQSLNGAVVSCRAGSSSSDLQVGNFTIQMIRTCETMPSYTCNVDW